jgi:cytochrome c oxidase subunit II
VNRIRALRRSPAPTRSQLRTLVLIGVLGTLTLLVFAPDAFAAVITPARGSPAADRISDLYRVTLYVAAVIFVGVEGTLFYTLIRFRRRKGRVAAQIHGNTRLELAWTGGAAVILVALAILTFSEVSSIHNPQDSPRSGLNLASSRFVVGGALEPPNGHALTVQVNGQQYIWRYTYANYATLADGLDAPFTYRDLYVPTNTVIRLKVVSQDVVHSWWVPALGGKVQADPGFANYAWFIAPHPGTYTGQCSFICGRGHARMTTVVIALTPSKWLAWLHGQEAAIKAANAAQKAARAAQQNQTGAAAVEVH